MKEKLKKTFTKHHTLSPLTWLERLTKSFSPAERVAFYVSSALLIIGAAGLLFNVNNLFLTAVPAQGGSLTEGIVGSPRFWNPLLAISDGDRDVTSLVYSGLLKATPDGKLIPDLAESFEISDDGLSYTFHLREKALFHDGTPVTPDDVVFTISRAQDPALKSPRRANWEGVAVEKVDERTVRLTLKQPYAPFLENATMGILPKHIWESADADESTFSPYNIEAVGSGPYKIARINRNSSGIPASIEFIPFSDYTLGAPYIEHLTIRFYTNEKDIVAALQSGEIESANSIAPDSAKNLEAKGFRIERTPLPRVFAVFFNQNQAPLLADANVRQALNLATDKRALVDSVLGGYGVPLDGPVPPLVLNQTAATDATTTEARLAQANALLDKAKWKLNPETGIREKTTGTSARGLPVHAQAGKSVQPLSFSLVTSEEPVLKQSAEQLVAMWKKIGVDVKLSIFESGDLNQNVIRPRKYDALLFGEVVGRDLDLFAFWDSSQRNDPGLNIAMYTNANVDKLLKEARRLSDEGKRTEDYQKVAAAIRNDNPAVFLYAPEFIYVVPQRIKGFAMQNVTVPSDRFLGITGWYIDTEKIWNIFTK